MRKVHTYKEKPSMYPILQGMDVPGDVDGVRAVAAWVHERRDEGWSVPFLSKDGLLLRHQPEGWPNSYHEWIAAGETLMWLGEEFCSMSGYEKIEEGD